MRSSRLGAALATLVASFAAGASVPAVRAATTWSSAVTTPRYAYVSNLDDGTINAFAIDSATGKLRPRGYVITGAATSVVTADPAGTNLIAGTYGAASKLISYSIDAAGNLTSVQTLSPYPGPRDATFSNDGSHLYYPNLDQNFLNHYGVNTGGSLSLTGPVSTGTWPETVAMHPTLPVCYVPNYLSNDLYTFNVGVGGTLTENVAARLAIGPGSPGPISMAVSPNGKWAYVASYDTSQISVLNLNTSTGAPTVLATVTNANVVNPTSIVIDKNSRWLYTSNDGNNAVSFFTINATTGNLTFNQNVSAGANPSRISLEPSNKYAYVANRTSNDVSVYSVTQSGGSAGRLVSLGRVRTHRQPYAIAITGGASAVSFTPRFAYVSNQDDDTISVYSVNSTTGALTAASPATVSSRGAQPLYLQIHPGGTFAYVINRSDSDATKRGIHAFSIDAATGALTPVGGLVPTDEGPRRFVIEPTGRFLYVVHDTASTIGCYSIAANGTLTRLSGSAGTVSIATNLWGIGIDPAGLYVLVPDRTNAVTFAYSINLTSGALTLASTSGAQGSDPRSLEFEPTGRFAYVGNLGNPDTSSYSFDSSATFGSLGTTNSTGTQCIQVAADPSGRWIYAANFGSNNVSQYTIGASGLLTLTRNTGVGTAPQGVTVDPSGRFVYVPNSGSDNVSAFTINSSTGNLSAVSGSPFPCGSRPHTVVVMGVVQ